MPSCSEYQKLLKGNDYELKYSKAMEYYEKKDYFRAMTLFEELYPLWIGLDKGEEIYFYYSYSHYALNDYLMAGYHFRKFAKSYPNSKHIEEVEYLSAYCYYLDSPESELDQTSTVRALDELQLFIDRYPNSERVAECNNLIEKLRSKLEQKAYENAKLYFDLGYYKAAVTSLKNSLKDYPDSQYREEILFLIVKSSYLLAQNSIEKKQVERYKSTITEYYTLVDEFPSTTHIKEAEKYFDSSREFIENSK